jgi:hypothetical protein
VFMEEKALEGLPAVHEHLRSWGRGQGLSDQGSTKVVELLEVEFLLSQSRERHWNRRGEFSIDAQCRYLW